MLDLDIPRSSNHSTTNSNGSLHDSTTSITYSPTTVKIPLSNEVKGMIDNFYRQSEQVQATKK